MKRALVFALFVSAGGCADRDVGLPAEDGQLYYPLGIATLDGDTERPRLLVHSTNFDQRFQSGQVSLLAADVIVDSVLRQLGVQGDASACSVVAARGPLFLPGFGAQELGAEAWLTRVRVPGVGGELLAAPVSGEASRDRIYVTNRFDTALLYISRDGDALACARPGEEPLANVDCSPAHVVNTLAEDPFSLARGVGPTGPYIAVGHLFGLLDGFESLGVVTFFDEAALVARSRTGGGSTFLGALRFSGARGISALATTSTAVRPDSSLLVLSGPREVPIALAAVELGEPGGQPELEGAPIAPVARGSVRLDSLLNATGARGMAVTPDGRRAVVTLRFAEQSGVTFNSAILSVDLTAPEPRALPAVEVGDELGAPFLRPSAPGEPLLAYVGDLRNDKVWIIDVTREVPRVIGEIGGRARRTLDTGEVIDARTLDGPSGISFVSRGGRRFGFVTNFAGSTLAVLDVSAANPRQHCLLARVGRDIDANGESEVDRRQ